MLSRRSFAAVVAATPSAATVAAAPAQGYGLSANSTLSFSVASPNAALVERVKGLLW